MQILKDEMRELIIDAAKKKFAAKGYRAATMSDIANEAGISVGNIYLYFKNKTDLFYTAVPSCIVDELQDIITTKLGTATSRLPNEFHSDPSYILTTEKLLDFFCKNRLEIISIMENSTGTSYELVRNNLIATLTNLFYNYKYSIRKDGLDATDEDKTGIIPIIYDNLLTGIVQLLKIHTQKETMRNSLTKLLAYHTHGLNAFI